jgi:hypothetical protein
VPLPFFSPAVLQAAIHMLPGQPSPEACAALLWGKLLRPCDLAWLLASCHQHLAAAAAPRHKQSCLAPLQVLVDLAGAHLLEPAVLR